jgi:hypothetical protein
VSTLRRELEGASTLSDCWAAQKRLDDAEAAYDRVRACERARSCFCSVASWLAAHGLG